MYSKVCQDQTRNGCLQQILNPTELGTVHQTLLGAVVHFALAREVNGCPQAEASAVDTIASSFHDHHVPIAEA